MNEELLRQTMDLFDKPEKWMAFWELHKKADDIRSRFWKRLQSEVYNRELKNANPDWDIYIWSPSIPWDIMWYIKGESNRSICVHFWGDGFRVHSNYGDLDVTKVSTLIKEPRFDILLSCFDRIDGRDEKSIGMESGNFRFGSESDGNFTSEQLAWYAGNKTEEFADQIIAKVRKFQTPEITALFKEINAKCKK